MKTKPLTQLRELIATALKSQTNLSKSFSILLHRDHGTYTHTTRTTQLHPDGEVRTFVRKQVPTELQEVIRLAVVQPISRFRDDVNLKYLYTGPKSGKRGRPQKFAGKIDLKNLDMYVFTEDYTTEGKLVYKMYTAVVWAVSLGCEVRVVLVDYEDAEKKRQTRKVFFSTDTSISARDIFDIYRRDSIFTTTPYGDLMNVVAASF